MTRTPRLSHYIGNLTRGVRTRVPAALSRKTMAYAGAGLALAGVAGVAGAAATARLAGDPAAAAGAERAVSRAVQGHTAPAGHASPAKHNAPGQAQAAKHSTQAKHEETSAAAERIVVGATHPQPGHAQLRPQDMLTPAGTSGPQTWMPITPARYANAKTIVRQAIANHMGLRSAVIAVATSMQEATLLNLSYGDSDSLGLFQQRPSCGWGTPAQIQRPAHAAGAFLRALRSYQARNPDWARQPLWESAQGVQGSAFPAAYARWEAQAAHLVAAVADHMI
jgi:hypothetical protein